MPTTMKRNPCRPSLEASSRIAAAAAKPPMSEPAVSAAHPPPAISTRIMPVYDPLARPITSGLASGLRVNVWNTAPAAPRAAPNASADAARGRRHSSTAVRSSPSVAPVNDPIICAIVTG